MRRRTPSRVATTVVALAITALGSPSIFGQGKPLPAPPVAPPQSARDSGPVPRPHGTAALSGSVVQADAGRPIRRARVTLAGVDLSFVKTVQADDQGGFAFIELPAGRFTLTASKPGYLDSIFGQKQPGSGRAGTPIQLADGQRVERVSLPIARGSVLTGTIVDDHNEPVFGAQVRALRYQMRTGEKTLVQGGSATTDDRGIYRMPTLLPGEYIVTATINEAAINDMMAVAEMKMRAVEVSAAAGGGADLEGMKVMLDAVKSGMADGGTDATSGYAPVYYPGSTVPSAASTITIGVNEERANLDLQVPLVPLMRLSGIVTGGDYAQNSTVLLIDNQALPGSSPRMTRVGPENRFSFANVAPGQYTVVATATQGGPGGTVKIKAATQEITRVESTGEYMQWFATADVTTDGHALPPMLLALQPGQTVTGRLTFNGAAPVPTDLSKLRVTMQPAAASPTANQSRVPPATVDASGRFTITGVVPGRYRVTAANMPSPWRVASSVALGRDSMDLPLEVKSGEDVSSVVVTLSDRVTDLSGSLQDPAGRPTADFTVIVFPEERQYWTPQSRRIDAARPSTQGQFSFRGLPPGSYRLIAVTDVETGQWFDPAFLSQLVGLSVSLTLTDGERKIQSLRVGSGLVF